MKPLVHKTLATKSREGDNAFAAPSGIGPTEQNIVPPPELVHNLRHAKPEHPMNFIARAGGQMADQLVKNSYAEVVCTVDWRPYATALETSVTDSAWVTEPGLVLSNAFMSAGVTSVEIAGGVPADSVFVENRVEFADRSRDVFRIRVQLIGTA